MEKASRIPGILWLLAWLVVGFVVAHVAAAHAADASPASAQAMYQVAERVAPSVVVVRARGRDTMPGSERRITETGTGVLVSRSGRVLTAAYVVHGMDEISVQFASGQTVTAHVMAFAPVSADVAVLQLDRVPAGAIVSPLADPDSLHVGDRAFILGAASRLPYSLGVGSIKARWLPDAASETLPLAELFQADATGDVESPSGPMFNARGELIGFVAAQDLVVTLNTPGRVLVAKP